MRKTCKTSEKDIEKLPKRCKTLEDEAVECSNNGEHHNAASKYMQLAAYLSLLGNDERRAQAMLSSSNSWEEFGKELLTQSDEYESNKRLKLKVSAFKAFTLAAYAINSIGAENFDIRRDALIKRAEETVKGIPERIKGWSRPKIRISRSQARVMIFTMKLPKHLIRMDND